MCIRLGKKQTNMHRDLYVAYRNEEEGMHALENTFYSVREHFLLREHILPMRCSVTYT
jgi:hypothetical protein